MWSRRSVLSKVSRSNTTHAGLWLDKFLEAQTVKDDAKSAEASAAPAREAASSAVGAKARLIQEISALPIPDGYREALSRREDLFKKLHEPGIAHSCVATTLGRLIIGLGQKGPVEAGLALEHTWGVPVLPGSALKGLAAAAAHQLLAEPAWHKDGKGRISPKQGVPGDDLAAIAGTLEHIGGVVFHDAWWMPGDGETKLPIHLDVMTVHHQDYYSSQGQSPPTDMDNPNPVSFASVTGKFLVVVEKSHSNVESGYLEAALCILRVGLARLGIGAKTNAGYGRMALDFRSAAERAADAACQAAKNEALLRAQQEADLRKADLRIRAAKEEAQGLIHRLQIGQAAHDVPKILRLAEQMEPSEARRIALQAVEKLTPRKVREKAEAGQPWALSLRNATE